ncbi:MAG TPA: NAD(P)H-hydrate dehydratase [Steroidobacteraceae bacterium]|nr:NAD(P)H-hydrate dehydratase [Steroidobacteraceae bacterium]
MASLPTALYTAAQVRALDRYAIDTLGIPGFTLMTRAGEAALRALRGRWPQAQRLVVLCGNGNNGGDGYVLATLARRASLQVEVATLADPQRLSGDAQRAWQECRDAGVAIRSFEAARLAWADVVVDALFGTGLDRPLDAGTCEVVEQVNASGRPVLAIDLPSGLNADTGRIMGRCIQATRTVSFIGLKLGLFLGAGPDVTGELEFDALDVTVPEQVARPAVDRLDREFINRVLPRRRRTAHKGEFGHVLIVAGGAGMPGAARLCAEACLRSGAGLVTVATRAANLTAVMAGRPELMCHGVEDLPALEPLIQQADVIVSGPGLGRDTWARAMFDSVQNAERPLVLDADALNLLATNPRRRDDWILTPHPGEAGRLLGTDANAVQNDRVAALTELHARFGGVVVLKGAGTLIGSNGDTPALCNRGNPGMATAGMGDVLAGITGALLAQLRDPWTAARAAVLAHALAGDAAAQAGERGMIASDVIARLPACLNPQRST